MRTAQREVAREDRGGVAPHGARPLVGAVLERASRESTRDIRRPAADEIAVDEVVVDEECGVQQLERERHARDERAILAAEAAIGGPHEAGTHALAA